MQGCLLAPHSSKAYVDAVSLTHIGAVKPGGVVQFSQGAQQEMPHGLVSLGQHLQDRNAQATGSALVRPCVDVGADWGAAVPGTVGRHGVELLLLDGDGATAAWRAAVVRLAVRVQHCESGVTAGMPVARRRRKAGLPSALGAACAAPLANLGEARLMRVAARLRQQVHQVHQNASNLRMTCTGASP